MFSRSLFRTRSALGTLLLFGAVQAQAKERSDTVPLDQVILVTKAALNDYQTQAQASEGTKELLPALASADFDLKTVVDTKGGGGVNLFVFTLGATREKVVTDDLDFLYMPEPKNEAAHFRSTDTKSLYKDLLDTLKEAAKAIAQSSAVSGGAPDRIALDFCQLTVTIAFSVTTDIKGQVTVPFQLVTVSGNLERSKNNVQQVKLTFKVTDQNIKACAAKP